MPLDPIQQLKSIVADAALAHELERLERQIARVVIGCAAIQQCREPTTCEILDMLNLILSTIADNIRAGHHADLRESVASAVAEVRRKHGASR